MKFTLLIFTCFTYIAIGQNAIIKEISRTNPITKEIYIFPKITLPASYINSQKINTLLRYDILYLEKETKDKRIFNEVWMTKKQMTQVGNISYVIKQNDNKFLSLSISAEGCGAYCEGFTKDYTFNAQTGNILTIDSIFTKEGFKMLVDSLNINKVELIKAKLDEATDSLIHNSTQNNPEAIEYYTYMIELYQSCLESKIELSYISGFIIQDGKLSLSTSRCSAHYNQNVDEIGEFEYSLYLENWKNYLTPFAISTLK